MRNMWRHRPPRRQLINFPRTYFKVEDVRPSEDQGQANSEAIFASTPGGILIPGELNQNILQFLTGRDLLRAAKVSKTIERVVRKCKALLFDAVHERIDEFVDRNGRQVNLHRFKKKESCAHSWDTWRSS
jgi:hypothetical protein